MISGTQSGLLTLPLAPGLAADYNGFVAQSHTSTTPARSLTRRFTVVIEKDADGMLVGTVPALHGCHTQARSLDELLQRVREAIELCLEVEGEASAPSLELVGIQSVAV